MSDFTNITARLHLTTSSQDPAGVQALLETLRKSQAWQDLDDQKDTTPSQCPSQANVELPGNASSSVPKKSVTPEVLKDTSESSPDILSLLARLQSTAEATSSRSTSTPIPTNRHIESAYPGHATRDIPAIPPVIHRLTAPLHHEKPPKKPALRPKSLRNMAYGQALLVIAELASDASFHENLKKIREQQNSLEKQLWEERTRIFKGQKERIKVAEKKAAIIGVNISEKEANSLSRSQEFRTSFMNEIKEFDLERVSSAWDNLITSQQRTLEELGVPGMFVTRDKIEREKQQRIIQVLEGLSGPDGSDNGVSAEIEQEEEP
ncbi:hypothetical protein Clacol_001923 [Clathrus columnatus]|uniref:Uncharacterized protein n=1 Tax=Clathrus columnatus TaxID=1419009 RepID=A0AAV5A3D3_9AGAM|nr:hypothetical protein Clacol_001923 [Clathrus columnatus]